MEKQIHPFVDKRIEDYCKQHTSEESDDLKYIDRQTHLRFLKPNMLSGNWQGNLLKVLSLLVQPKSVLEIGTFTASFIRLRKTLCWKTSFFRPSTNTDTATE